jgi:hypothetical protein
MAESTLQGVEGDVHDASPVDTDRGQDPAGEDALGQSFLARHSLCHASGAHHLGEFLLPYDDVRSAKDPDSALLAFLQATYEAAAKTGGWDRAGLERPPVPPRA